MAKVTLNDLSTTLANSAAATINANNAKIEAALEKTLSRDGTSPNQMEADLDMNHNDVFNVDNLHADVIVLNGVTIVPTEVGALPEDVMLKPDYDPHLIYTVATRTELKATETTRFSSAYLKESGREGVFKWTVGDFSAFITADTYEALYVKADAVPSTAGAWVRQRESLDILVDWAGVVKGTSTEAAANTLKLQSVCTLAGILKNNVFLGSGTIFKDLNALHIDSGVREFYGLGNARWHNLYNGTFFESPSQIALFDTGVTPTLVFKPFGISSMHASGASRDNSVSASPGTVNNSEYRMQTFCDNTTGALSLTAGIIVHSTESENLRLRDFRIFPSHGGAAGLDGYNNWATATNADNWAQNGACDFGIVQDGTNRVTYERVQCVGHFMRSGLLICASDGRTRFDHSPVTTWSAPYHTRVTNCLIEGWKAFAIRGPDKYQVLALTSDSLTIPYSTDNPFVAVGAGNLHFTLLTSAFSGTTCSWSSVVQSTFAGEDVFVFSGLGVDPTSVISVGDFVSPFVAGGGTSHIIVDGGTKIDMIKHPTGRLCYDVALTNAFTYPDTMIEMSGLAMVEVTFRDVDLQPSGEVFIHTHEVQDVYFEDINLERGTSVTWPSGHRTGRIICSPDPGSNFHVPSNHAAGRSYGVLFNGYNIQQSQQADFAPHWHVQQRNEFSGDNGFYEPAWGNIPTIATESTPDNYGTFIRAGINRRAGIAEAVYDRFTNTFSPVFWYEDGTLGDRLRTAKDIIPNFNASWDLGSPTLGFENGNFRGVVFVTDDTSGAIPAFGSTSSVSGTWTNAVGAYQASRNNVSGLWQRTGTDGTVHQFYRDTTIVGSISVTAAATAYNTSSSKTLKENWRDFDAGTIIDGIDAWLYDWKNGAGSAYGVLAQDVNEVFPDAVTTDEDPDMWAVDYSKFVPLLLKEVKELRKRVAELEQN